MGDSSWLDDKLSHQEYNNWVKGNLILQELKTGLVPFLDGEARDLQRYVLRHVPASSVACTVCTGDDLRNGKYVCPSGICTTILQVINTEYTHHPHGTVNLVNTHNQTWCDTARYWEIAKAYISTPGYDSKTSAAETDCVGLLTIIINCTKIQSVLSVIPDVFKQVKTIRNLMLHSDNCLDSDQLDDLYTISLQILQDSYYSVDSTAKTALARITQIKEKTLSVSDVNLPGLLFIVEELEAEQGKHREAIGHLETQSASLETDSQNLKDWQKLVKTEMEELANQQTKQKEAISQLDTTVSHLGTRVSDHHAEHRHAVSQLGTRVRDNHAEHQQAISQLGTRVSSVEDSSFTENIQMTRELKHYLVNEKYKGEILQGELSQWFKMKDVLQMFVPLQIREDLERWMALSCTERKKEMPSQAEIDSKSRRVFDILTGQQDKQLISKDELTGVPNARLEKICDIVNQVYQQKHDEL